MRPEIALLGLHGWRPRAGRLPYVAKAPTKDADFAIEVIAITSFEKIIRTIEVFLSID